jgi:hypothetical protein
MTDIDNEVLEVLAQIGRGHAGHRIRQWLQAHAMQWHRQAIYGETADKRAIGAGATRVLEALMNELNTAEATLKAKREAT